MISLLTSTLIAAVPFQGDVNRACAYIVGIPYASDNFSDEEWERFKVCKKYIRLQQ